MRSKILRAMTKDGSARVFVIDGKAMVGNALRFHPCAPTAAAAFARVLMGASMMGCMLKDKGNTLTLRFAGDGPIGHVLAVSDYCGNVKGYPANPNVELPRRLDGHLDVGGAIGQGTLQVVRDLGLKEPFNGITPLVSGEVAEDIAAYFAESEQTPTMCALGVRISQSGLVAAGGVLVQLLPFAAEETVAKLEENAKGLASISAMFERGASCAEVMETALEGIPFDVFDEIPVDYVCDCSKDRMGEALLTLGPYELFRLFSEEKEIETECHFCGTKYRFTPADVEAARKRKEARIAAEKQKAEQAKKDE